MDKQKQIEEMVDLYIQHSILEFDKHGFSATARQMYIEKLRITMFEICSVFFEEGYRKLPENAVVLTREELQGIKMHEFMRGETCGSAKSLGGYLEQVERAKTKVRKETAERFAQRFKALFPIKEDVLSFALPEDIQRAVDEIAKGITGGGNESD